MWDESEEVEEIRCPFCGCEGYEECEHLLIHFDVTCSDCIGGKAEEYMPRFAAAVEKAFSEFLAAGKHPNWDRWEMADIWKDARAGAVDDPAGLSIGGSMYYRMVFAALEEAGGFEHPGSLVSSSGAYCESSVKLMHAEKPEEVCVKALSLIERWVVEEKPPRPPRKRRRKQQ